MPSLSDKYYGCLHILKMQHSNEIHSTSTNPDSLEPPLTTNWLQRMASASFFRKKVDIFLCTTVTINFILTGATHDDNKLILQKGFCIFLQKDGGHFSFVCLCMQMWPRYFSVCIWKSNMCLWSKTEKVPRDVWSTKSGKSRQSWEKYWCLALIAIRLEQKVYMGIIVAKTLSIRPINGFNDILSLDSYFDIFFSEEENWGKKCDEFSREE